MVHRPPLCPLPPPLLLSLRDAERWNNAAWARAHPVGPLRRECVSSDGER